MTSMTCGWDVLAKAFGVDEAEAERRVGRDSDGMFGLTPLEMLMTLAEYGVRCALVQPVLSHEGHSPDELVLHGFLIGRIGQWRLMRHVRDEGGRALVAYATEKTASGGHWAYIEKPEDFTEEILTKTQIAVLIEPNRRPTLALSETAVLRPRKAD